MKKIDSFLALLTLFITGTSWTANDANPQPHFWWQQENPKATLSDGNQHPCAVIVDNIQGQSETIAVGIIYFQDHAAWAVFTKDGTYRYNPVINEFGNDVKMQNYVSIDELNADLRAHAVNPPNIPLQPQQPATQNPGDINPGDANPNNVNATAKEGLMKSALSFVSRNRAYFITIGASTGAAITFAYLTDLYNKKYKKNINKVRVAATAWVATATVLGGYFYFTAVPATVVNP